MSVTIKARSTLQHASEILALLDFVLARGRLDTVLEIGTYEGGTAYLWAQVARRVICVDVKFGSDKMEPVYRGTALEPRIIEIEGRSEDEATVQRVRKALGDMAVSLLFIDGNHTYYGASTDFTLYSPSVCEGGWIVLHDIVNPRWGVQQFWEELKEMYPQQYSEFILGQQPAEERSTVWGDDLQGIGLVRKEY